MRSTCFVHINPIIAIVVVVLIVVSILAVFIGVTIICQFLGSNFLINPALAAWCPVLLFVPLAFGMAQPFYE